MAPGPSRLSFLVLAAAALAACGPETPEVATAPPGEPEVASIAGMYRVEGTTTVIGSEESRAISGRLILAQEGTSWTATFDLDTLYPGPHGALRAEVVGEGNGTIRGTALEGTARTQIVAGRVPGIDAHFIMVPPAFGVRIVSDSTGTANPDGSLTFHLENRGAEGEAYLPTRTEVRGVRMPEP